jgi:type 1 glutamine amidotransferase
MQFDTLNQLRTSLVFSILLTASAMLPVTSAWGQTEVSADIVARIADALPAAASKIPASPRHVLIYSRTLGFRHASIPAGAKAIQMLGEKTRAFTAVHSEDPAMFDADTLSKFDAVIMLNTTGECLADSNEAKDVNSPSAERRKQNLQQFVASGKGLLGIHSATDTMYSSKEYGDLIGGWFTGHPWHTEVPLKIDSPGHPLTSMFDADKGYVIKDEIYQFAPRGQSESFAGYQPYSRDKLRVLLSLNVDQFDVSAGKRNDGDYAISWIHEVDGGRVFYTVLGHNDFIFWDPVILQHYLAGIQYVLGDLPADARPSTQLSP